MSLEKAAELIIEKFPLILRKLVENKKIQEELYQEAFSILEKIPIEELEGKKPTTIAGSCLFLASIIISQPISKKDIADQLKISIKSIYKISSTIRKILIKSNSNYSEKFIASIE